MTRSLKCQMTNDQGRITSLPKHTCEHYEVVKPPTEANCNFDIPCLGKCYIRVLFSCLFPFVGDYYLIL